MTSIIIEYSIFLFCLELFEIFWQKGTSLFAYIHSMLKIYKKSIILFLFLHPSFYFMLYCIVSYNIESALFLSMTLMKMVDIAIKLELLDRINYKKPLGVFTPIVKADQTLPFGLKLLPAFLYSGLFYISFA